VGAFFAKPALMTLRSSALMFIIIGIMTVNTLYRQSGSLQVQRQSYASVNASVDYGRNNIESVRQLAQGCALGNPGTTCQ